MFNQFKLYNYTNSLVSSDGFGRHEGQLFTGDIINGLDCVVGTGLQVTVNPGNAIIRYGSGGSASAYLVSGIATWTGTLATADASNPRIDAVVLFVKSDTNLPSGTPTSANQDGQGVPQIALVSGTPNANPTAPTATQIQAAIGSSSYPYTVLWNWRVNAGQGALSATNGTDVRVFAAPTNAQALGAQSYIDNGGVASYTASTLNGNITGGLAKINVGGVMVPQSFNALSITMAASKDRYFYVTLGNSTIQAASDVTVGGASPTLPANSVWVSIYTSGASAITGIRQGGVDTNSKPIYPTNGLAGAQQAWQTATLGTGWIGFDAGGPSGFGFPQYMKDSLGFVHVRGLIKNSSGSSNTSSSNSLLLTLPAGYRPGQSMRMPVINSDTFGDIDFKSDGTVVIASTMTVTSGGWVGLNNLHFKAEM